VDNFLSLIFSYFSFLVLAGRPYQGSYPLLKYIKTNPRLSRSSLLLYSIPKCVLTDAYLAVPVKFFPSLYGMCSPVLGSLNLLANPKSITYTKCCFLLMPIKKLSGFTSLWRKCLECINSNRYSYKIKLVNISNLITYHLIS